MTNDQHTAYHGATSNATSLTSLTSLAQASYDALYYSRYPTPEAEAMMAYDAACVATINAEELYERCLCDGVYYRQYQPGCVDFNSVVLLDQAAAVARARAAEATAKARLEQVRRELREGRL